MNTQDIDTLTTGAYNFLLLATKRSYLIQNVSKMSQLKIIQFCIRRILEDHCFLYSILLVNLCV